MHPHVEGTWKPHLLIATVSCRTPQVWVKIQIYPVWAINTVSYRKLKQHIHTLGTSGPGSVWPAVSSWPHGSVLCFFCVSLQTDFLHLAFRSSIALCQLLVSAAYSKSWPLWKWIQPSSCWGSGFMWEYGSTKGAKECIECIEEQGRGAGDVPGGGDASASQKMRCLPLLVFLHVPEDVPCIWVPAWNHLADFTVIFQTPFFLAACQLQALIIIILQQACTCASNSFVKLSLIYLKSPERERDRVFKTTEGWAVSSPSCW